MAKTSQANKVILGSDEQEVNRVTLQAIATLIQGLSPEKVNGQWFSLIKGRKDYWAKD
jgi:hypothetical protein